MPRVKRGTQHVKRRAGILKQTKGFKWGRKKLIRRAKEALKASAKSTYQGRKKRKANKRVEWQLVISAAAKSHGTSYSKMIGMLKKANIELDRKILAELAKSHPEVFTQILEIAQKNPIAKEPAAKAEKPEVKVPEKKAPVKKAAVKKTATKKTTTTKKTAKPSPKKK